MKILVVDDDTAVVNIVRSHLMSASHVVETANDGAEGSFLGRNYDYDAMILDYSLPKKDGLVVCSEVRRAGKTTPIIFLSVSDETPLKIAALDNGADDFVTKPFSMQELCARIKAVARRPSVIRENLLRIDDLILDTEKRTAIRDDINLNLTHKEIILLEYLMKNVGVILSRAMIIEHVWTADADPLSNTVEAHIRNLRRKMTVNGKPDLISNIQGRGYVMNLPKCAEIASI